MSTVGAIQLVDVTTGEPVGETGHNRIIVHLKKCRILEVLAKAHITFDKQEASDKQFIEFSVNFKRQVPGANLVNPGPGRIDEASEEIIPSLNADPLPDGRFSYLWTWSVRIDTADYGYGAYQINLSVHKGNPMAASSSRKTAILELSP